MPYTMDIKPARRAGARPDAVVELSGAWRGRLVDTCGDAESFNLERDASDPRLPGQFHLFTTPAGLAAGARLLEAGERTFVVLIGPYLDPGSHRAVVTVLEGNLDAGGMGGEFHTRLHGGRETVRQGRFTATRTEKVTRAA
jgi:hypothetical protein